MAEKNLVENRSFLIMWAKPDPFTTTVNKIVNPGINPIMLVTVILNGIIHPNFER